MDGQSQPCGHCRALGASAACTDPLGQPLARDPWGSTMLDPISPQGPGLWLILGQLSPLLGGRGARCSPVGLSALLALTQLHHVLVE